MMKYLKSRYTMTLIGILALALVLGAWSTTTLTSASAAHATPKSTPAIKLATIKGSGYKIGNPAGWTSYKSAASGISMLVLWPKTSRTTFFIVETFDNPFGITPKRTVKVMLDVLKGQEKNAHLKNVPATITINGNSWSEGAITATDSSKHANVVINVMATSFPHGNKLALIIRMAKISEFNKLDANEFKQMLSSFKFA